MIDLFCKGIKIDLLCNFNISRASERKTSSNHMLSRKLINPAKVIYTNKCLGELFLIAFCFFQQADEAINVLIDMKHNLREKTSRNLKNELPYSLCHCMSQNILQLGSLDIPLTFLFTE